MQCKVKIKQFIKLQQYKNTLLSAILSAMPVELFKDKKLTLKYHYTNENVLHYTMLPYN